MRWIFRPKARLLHWWFRRKKKHAPIVPPVVTTAVTDELGNFLTDENANIISY